MDMYADNVMSELSDTAESEVVVEANRDSVKVSTALAFLRMVDSLIVAVGTLFR